MPELNKKTHVQAECESCGATGIYRGMAEPEGVGVICLVCKGTGAVKLEYTPFHRPQAPEGREDGPAERRDLHRGPHRADREIRHLLRVPGGNPAMSVLSLLSFLISLVSLVGTYLLRRKMRLFKAHILVARGYLHSSVKAGNDGKFLEADLLLDAANEELEKAKKYA
jgi:hypothetical protein